MPIIEETIEITAPRANVFKLCQQLNRWPDWNEQVSHVEMVSPAPLRSGSWLRIDSKPERGGVFSWDAEVVELQMPSGLRLRVMDVAKSSPFAPGSELTWQLESVGSGTRFTWRWDYQPQGIISKITDKLGGQSAARRTIQQSLENLRATLVG